MKSRSHDAAMKQLRAICLALPEVTEVMAWGHPTFRAGKKLFAGCGVDEVGLTLGLKVGFERQEELLKQERFFPTPYAAHQGWVSLRIDNETDWDEVNQLAREAYRQVAL